MLILTAIVVWAQNLKTAISGVCVWGGPHSYPDLSEGLTERINEPPWGRCLQGAVDARWVVVVVSCCFFVVVASQGVIWD